MRTTAKRIRDMRPGEVGYTMPWACRDGKLDEDFPLTKKGGTASLRIERKANGSYKLTPEKPVYASPPERRQVRDDNEVPRLAARLRKDEVTLLAHELRETKCEVARLTYEQALVDSLLVAMDGKLYLEAARMYESPTERAADLALAHQTAPEYPDLNKKSLALERLLAEADAAVLELSVLLALEMDGVHDWSESPDLCEDCGLYRSEISAALSAKAQKERSGQDMAKSEPSKTETYIRGKALLEDIETFQHE